MTFKQKTQHFELYLNISKENYADTFKQDIIIYTIEDFIIDNLKLQFLINLTSEIENFIDKLTSNFVMNYDSDYEIENDFIHQYINYQ